MESKHSNGVSNGDMDNGNLDSIEAEKIAISVENESCFYCRKPATKVCKYCKIAYYCSDEHGKIHRPDDVCFPFKIDFLQHVGNFMVASRDIEPAGTFSITLIILYTGKKIRFKANRMIFSCTFRAYIIRQSGIGGTSYVE